MNLNEYQTSIPRFVRYAPSAERQYLALGLVSEIGELAGKFAKRLRGDAVADPDIIAEMGDCLFFIYMIRNRYGVDIKPTVRTLHVRHADDAIKHLFDGAASVYAEMQRDTVTPITLCVLEDVIAHLGKLHNGMTLEDIAAANYEKLCGRAERQTIHGNGDVR